MTRDESESPKRCPDPACGKTWAEHPDGGFCPVPPRGCPPLSEFQPEFQFPLRESQAERVEGERTFETNPDDPCGPLVERAASSQGPDVEAETRCGGVGRLVTQWEPTISFGKACPGCPDCQTPEGDRGGPWVRVVALTEGQVEVVGKVVGAWDKAEIDLLTEEERTALYEITRDWANNGWVPE